MVRILLASGEEAVYRTVEELALGISSGTITAAARVFDAHSQDWRSIDSHPDYHEALARAAILSPAADLDHEPVVAVPSLPPVPSGRAFGPFQIYQMFSRSAAELQARRRPARLVPALTVVAGVVMVASMMVVMRREAGQARSVEESSRVRDAEPTSTARAASSITDVQAMRLAPFNLAGHRVAAAEAAGRDLSGDAARLGIGGVLGSQRLAVADSVRAGRARLATLQALIEKYRGALRHADQVYQDSASGLVKSGFWSRVDEQEWRVRTKPLEERRDAARADSLLQALERVYDLLIDKSGHYQPMGSRVQFEDPGVGQAYDQLLAGLARFSEPRDSVGPAGGPLAVLLQAVNGASSRPQHPPVSP